MRALLGIFLLGAAAACAAASAPIVLYPEARRVELQVVPPGPEVFELAAPTRLSKAQRRQIDQAMRITDRPGSGGNCRDGEMAYFITYLAAGERQVGQLQVCLCSQRLEATPNPLSSGQRLTADFTALGRIDPRMTARDCPAS